LHSLHKIQLITSPRGPPKINSYSEGISLLYSTTHFRFGPLRDLPFFVPVPRIAQITSLSLSLTITRDADPVLGGWPKYHYDDYWKVLAALSALRELRVEILAPIYPPAGGVELAEPEHLERAWLGPLQLLKQDGLEVFEVVFPREYALRFADAVKAARVRYQLLEAVDGELSSRRE
jgi:hypothetical protein